MVECHIFITLDKKPSRKIHTKKETIAVYIQKIV